MDKKEFLQLWTSVAESEEVTVPVDGPRKYSDTAAIKEVLLRHNAYFVTQASPPGQGDTLFLAASLKKTKALIKVLSVNLKFLCFLLFDMFYLSVGQCCGWLLRGGCACYGTRRPPPSRADRASCAVSCDPRLAGLIVQGKAEQLVIMASNVRRHSC